MPNSSDSSPSSRPLIVDMDGTLLLGDMFASFAGYLWRTRRLYFLGLLFSRLGLGLAQFKWSVFTAAASFDPALRANEPLVDFLRAQKSAGRTILLVSASPEFAVQKAAQKFPDLFDAAIGSSETHNLRAQAKAHYLCDQYGFAGFDYIGNSVADVPVWRAAHTAYNVNPRWHISLWSFLRSVRGMKVVAKTPR